MDAIEFIKQLRRMNEKGVPKNRFIYLRVGRAVSSGEALCTLSGKPMQQDDFCSYGEPKEEPHADDHD